MEKTKKKTIKEISTQQLLDLRSYFFRMEWNQEMGEWDFPKTWSKNNNEEITQSQLYEELALRPHILNTLERKKERMIKAKQRKNSDRDRCNRNG